jgi:hypothetical protein
MPLSKQSDLFFQYVTQPFSFGIGVPAGMPQEASGVNVIKLFLFVVDGGTK